MEWDRDDRRARNVSGTKERRHPKIRGAGFSTAPSPRLRKQRVRGQPQKHVQMQNLADFFVGERRRGRKEERQMEAEQQQPFSSCQAVANLTHKHVIDRTPLICVCSAITG